MMDKNSGRSKFAISWEAFISENEDWQTEPKDDVSLSKYSIYMLLTSFSKLPKKDQTDLVTSYVLRVSALKREFDGASKYILWAFDGPSAAERRARYRLDQYRPQYTRDSSQYSRRPEPIGNPEDEMFTEWARLKKSGHEITRPDWNWLSLTDFADEFLHLSRELNAILPNQFDLLDKIIYFKKGEDLVKLAHKVLEETGRKRREEPVELLAKALKQFGLESVKNQKSFSNELDRDDTKTRSSSQT